MITNMSEPTPIPAPTPTPAPEAAKAPEAAPLITPEAKEPPGPADALAAVAKKEPAAEVKYEFKAPEGYDTKQLEAFARENKIAPDVAQKLVERDVQIVENLKQKAVAEFKELSEKVWVQEIYNDKELGGPNIDKTRVNVMKAWQELPKALREEISSIGVHTNPQLVRVLNHFGKMTKEDKIVGPPSASPPVKARPGLEAMFAEIHKSA